MANSAAGAGGAVPLEAGATNGGSARGPSGGGGSSEQGGRSSNAPGGAAGESVSAAGMGGRSGAGGAATGGSDGTGAGGLPAASGTAGNSAQGGVGVLGGAPQGGASSAGAPGGSSSGIAGHAGGAGAPTTFCTPALVVDDMEDGDALTCGNQGRGGDWWSASGTPTGSIDPPTNEDFPAYALGTDARSGSHYGMRLSGTGFGHTDDDWASIGFFLAGGSTYDLTSYNGLTFYGKSRGGSTKVHVEFATLTTTPTSDGGACDSDCTDHFEQILTLGEDWQQLTVPFSGLAQEGWGVKPKDLAHTIFVYFGYQGTDGGSGSFDFLIDDVILY